MGGALDQRSIDPAELEHSRSLMAELERWTERVVDAPSLEAVFAA
jgi:hypothetical protein